MAKQREFEVQTESFHNPGMKEQTSTFIASLLQFDVQYIPEFKGVGSSRYTQCVNSACMIDL